MPAGKTLDVLLVEHVPLLAFPGIADHVQQTLERDFGCAVTRVLPWQFTAALVGRGRWKAVLVLHGGAVDLNVVALARKRGMRVALWITEDPYELDLHLRWPDFYDWVFTNDSAALSAYRRPNVRYLPWCANPRLYRPMTVPPAYRCDVCLVGQGFPNRIPILNAVAHLLDDLDVKLVGNWTSWGDLLDPRLKRFVVPEAWSPQQAVLYYNGARINLNIHRDPSPTVMADNRNSRHVPARSPNVRVFDIAACGAFQLVDATRPDLASCYRPGRELVTFDTAEDLARKLVYYLNHPEQRKAIAQAARSRTLREHTFRHRLQTVLEALTGKRGALAGEPRDRFTWAPPGWTGTGMRFAPAPWSSKAWAPVGPARALSVAGGDSHAFRGANA